MQWSMIPAPGINACVSVLYVDSSKLSFSVLSLCMKWSWLTLQGSRCGLKGNWRLLFAWSLVWSVDREYNFIHCFCDRTIGCVSTPWKMFNSSLLCRLTACFTQCRCVDSLSQVLIPWMIWRSMLDVAQTSYLYPRMIPASNVKLIPSRLMLRCTCSFPFVVISNAFHIAIGMKLIGR